MSAMCVEENGLPFMIALFRMWTLTFPKGVLVILFQAYNGVFPVQ